MTVAVEAAYIHIRPLPEGETVYRTVHLSDSLLVDLDADGRVLGVETIGRPCGAYDYFLIVRAIGETL